MIYTLGYFWQGREYDEQRLLTACYQKSLMLAKEYCLESIAFPLISAGAYDYPSDLALKTAIASIDDFLLYHEISVMLVLDA